MSRRISTNLNDYLSIFILLGIFFTESHGFNLQNAAVTRDQIGYGYDLLTNDLTLPVFESNNTCIEMEILLDKSDIMSRKQFLVVESMNEYLLVNSRTMSKQSNLAGAFSAEYRHKKQVLNFNDYVYLRVLFSHDKIKQRMVNCDLHVNFQKEINSILTAIRQDRMEKARYLAQFLIKDYGTHAIASNHMGASLFMEIFVENNYYQSVMKAENKDLESIMIGYFDNKYDLGLNNITISEPADLIKFAENSHHSHVFAIGGTFSRGSGKIFVAHRYLNFGLF
jgi:hypothetical protein